jgi:hypothetical protein
MIRSIYVVVDEDDDPMEWTAQRTPRGAWAALKESYYDGPKEGETHQQWTIRKRKEGFKVMNFKRAEQCTKEGKGDE